MPGKKTPSTRTEPAPDREFLEGGPGETTLLKDVSFSRYFEKPIVIVGCGPGSAEYLTPAACQAVMAAEVMVGSVRLLDLFPESKAKRIPVTAKVDQVLDAVEAQLPHKRIALLVTGDPGLYSLSKLVVSRFGLDCCMVIPGISAVQVAFARLGLDWSDATIISAHKEDPQVDPDTLFKSGKIAILCGRSGVLMWIAELVQGDHAMNYSLFLAEDLTLPTERVLKVEVTELQALNAGPRTIVVMVRKELLP
jgi:cobalt-precorrin-7 (C5)-methyltransferase